MFLLTSGVGVFFAAAQEKNAPSGGLKVCYGDVNDQIGSCNITGSITNCYAFEPGFELKLAIENGEVCQDTKGNPTGCCDGICGAPCDLNLDNIEQGYGLDACYNAANEEVEECKAANGTCWWAPAGEPSKKKRCVDSAGAKAGCCMGICGVSCSDLDEIDMGSGSGLGPDTNLGDGKNGTVRRAEDEENVCYGDVNDQIGSCNITGSIKNCYAFLPGYELEMAVENGDVCKDDQGKPTGCCNGVCGKPCAHSIDDAPQGYGWDACYNGADKEVDSCSKKNETCFWAPAGKPSEKKTCVDSTGAKTGCCLGVCGESCDFLDDFDLGSGSGLGSATIEGNKGNSSNSSLGERRLTDASTKRRRVPRRANNARRL